MPNRAFALDDLALIELTGDDRREWLQGQATNDVRLLEPGGRLSFCFCEPTGQILAILDAWAQDGRIVMATARERVAAVLDRIESMTILEDVAARELPLYGTWVSVAPAPHISGLVLPSNRTEAGGWDVWVPEPALDTLHEDFEIVDPEPLRILAGVPKWGADVGPRTLPPELGSAFVTSHVSYSKGCYTGQEILMRMNTRGHANRTWVGLVAADPMAVGATVLYEGREIGRVSSSAPHPIEDGSFVAAATLRNEAASEGARVDVGGVTAEVRPIPMLRTR